MAGQAAPSESDSVTRQSMFLVQSTAEKHVSPH